MALLLGDVRQHRRQFDDLVPARLGVKATGESFSVRPSFLLPYAVATTDEVQGPLFLRAFGVPFWALARVFGRDDMYGYRLEVSLGRNTPFYSQGARLRATARTGHDRQACSSLLAAYCCAYQPVEKLCLTAVVC